MTYQTDGLRDQERRAVEAVYNRYAAWLNRQLIRRYGAQDAEDLVQETWLRIMPYPGRDGIRHPKSLLLRIAANLVSDKFGRRRKRDAMEREVRESSGWSVALPSQPDEVLARQLVLSLPRPLRDVFVLSRVGGLTNCSARPGTW